MNHTARTSRPGPVFVSTTTGGRGGTWPGGWADGAGGGIDWLSGLLLAL
jgi:hypothetical protein